MRKAIAADACGCAMGARFLAIGLIVSSAWQVWHRGGLSVGRIALWIALWSFAAAIAGKIVGIAVFRYRSRRAAQIAAGSAGATFGSSRPAAARRYRH